MYFREREYYHFFQGVFKEYDDKWLIKYEEYSPLPICMLKNMPMQWFICSKSDKILDIESKKRNEMLLKSPIGYYGLYNPKEDQFCIRDIRDLKRGVGDLRKMTVGQICTNFDRDELVDIVARKMKITPGKKFVYKDTSIDELYKLLDDNKYTIQTDYDSDIDNIKRVIYWSSIFKGKTCKHIKTWFDEHDLMDENYECGSQSKQRSKSKK